MDRQGMITSMSPMNRESLTTQPMSLLGNHAQQAHDAGHEDVPHPPDAALVRQPSNDDQPAAPPPDQRPTRDRKMPSRFEDFYLHTITTDFNNYNMTKSSQQSFLDFPWGGDK